jgi:tetratricopeptide (TPR) repeat protein
MVRREIAMSAVIAVAAVLIPVGQARAELSGTEVVMCRDVRGMAPVAPGSTVFTGTDPQVCLLVTLFDVSLSHAVRFEVARPDGSIYEAFQRKTESAPFGETYRWYKQSFCVPIADGEPAYLVGDWTVRVLVDGRLIRAMIFQIISEGLGGEEKMQARLETMKARVDANPSDASARVDLAEVHIDLKEIDEAVVELNRAVELDPGWATPRAILGYLKRRQGNLDEAEHNLVQAIALRGDYSWAHYELGRVYKQKGETAKAIEQFRRVVQIEGNTSMRKSAEEELANLGAL